MLLYGSECWSEKIQNKQFANEIFTLFERCYIKGQDQIEEIRKKWNVEEMIDYIQNYQLKCN